MADVENVAAKVETPAKKFEKFAEKTAAITEKAAETTAETMSAKAETVVEKTTAGLKDVQEKLATGYHKAAEAAREAVDVQRSAIETVVEAGKIYGEGLQGLATKAAEAARVQFEDTMTHLRSLTTVKSVREAVDLQASFTRATLSRVLSESSVMAEDYLKVAEKALAPVTARAREAAEKVKTSV